MLMEPFHLNETRLYKTRPCLPSNTSSTTTEVSVPHVIQITLETLKVSFVFGRFPLFNLWFPRLTLFCSAGNPRCKTEEGDDVRTPETDHLTRAFISVRPQVMVSPSLLRVLP